MLSIRSHVDQLAASPRSSIYAPAAMQSALQYCDTQLRHAGMKVDDQPLVRTGITYRDVHPLWLFKLWPFTVRKLVGTNLLGTLPATTPLVTAPPLLLVAHLDTVKRTPGADDNASGVAVALDVARRAGELKTRTRDVYVAIVDFEEIGLIGSRLFTSANRDLLADTEPDVIVLESVGYFDDSPGAQQLPSVMAWHAPRQAAWIRQRECRGDFLVLGQRKHSNDLGTQVAAAVTEAGVPVLPFTDHRTRNPFTRVYTLSPAVGTFDRSDHKPFWQRGHRAVVLGGTVKYRGSPYHQPNDTPDVLDYRRLRQLSDGLMSLIVSS